MPHNPDRITRSLTRLLGLVALLLAAAPLVAEAQTRTTLSAEAVVVSSEGTRAWQAVVQRLAPAGNSAPAPSAGSTELLATIVDRTIGDSSDPLNRRRVLTVEYLRN